MRRSVIGPAVIISVLGLASAQAQPPSLGQLAQKEASRRGAIASPARVMTDADVSNVVPPLPEPEAPPPVPAMNPVRTNLPRMAWQPARYTAGALPPVAPLAVGGGDVMLEVALGQDGRVGAIDVLRDTPPFTEALSTAVKTWTFQPAEDVVVPEPGAKPDPATKRPIASKVLVLGLFRPPALFQGTLGTTPKTLGRPSEASPAPSSDAVMPLHPPNAMFDGAVLVQLNVGVDGRVETATVVRSAPGFDQPTLEALKSLSFRPSRVHGRPATANVYVVAAFRQPVTR